MDTTTKNTSVAVILEKNNKIALSFRLKTKTFPFCWAFVGGSIETDETQLQAAHRETLEETGLYIFKERFEYLCNCYDGGQFCAIYKVILNDDEIPKHTEKDKHTNWYWFDVNDIFNLKIMDGIREVLLKTYIKEI